MHLIFFFKLYSSLLFRKCSPDHIERSASINLHCVREKMMHMTKIVRRFDANYMVRDFTASLFPIGAFPTYNIHT